MCIRDRAWQRQQGAQVPSWGQQSARSVAATSLGLSLQTVAEDEARVETEASRIVRAMPLLWLRIEDVPGPENLRGRIERNSIALLSNRGRPPIDPPSAAWLGHQSGRPRVRESGLWNNNHVDEDYDPAFLDTLEQLTDDCSKG